MSAPSIFTQMLRGERPARFVWRDDIAAALLAPTPVQPGHVIVVPHDEVDYWIDLEPELAAHLMRVAQDVARAIQHAFRPVKVGLVIAGVEVRHVHLHLVPISSARDLDLARQDPQPDPARLDADAVRIRTALRALGHGDAVPD